MSVIQSILQCHFPFFFCHINFAWFSLVLHPCRLFRLLNSLVAWISVCSVTIIHSLVLSWLLPFCSVNKYALCKNKTNLQYGFVKLQRTCFHCFPHSRFVPDGCHVLTTKAETYEKKEKGTEETSTSKHFIIFFWPFPAYVCLFWISECKAVWTGLSNQASYRPSWKRKKHNIFSMSWWRSRIVVIKQWKVCIASACYCRFVKTFSYTKFVLL